MITALYIRASSQDQNTGRQFEELRRFTSQEPNLQEFAEKISGAVPAADRPEFSKILQLAKEKKLKRLVVQSIDRLGRNSLDIQHTIHDLTQLGVNITVTSLGVDTILANGKKNPVAGIIVAVLSQIAEQEREMIRERQQQGIRLAKQQGKYRQRPTRGPGKSNKNLVKEYPEVVKELRLGISVRKTAKLCGVSPSTVQRVKKELVK